MENRKELLKSYLKRLSTGEDLESVRRDFVEAFEDVDASEIMQAEQEMIASGTPITEVQKLCDVHSALFHGKTKTEKPVDGGKMVDASIARQQRAERTKLLENEKGHPLNTFFLENQAMSELIEDAKHELEAGNISDKLLAKLREIAIHYAKKGDLLYPHLKVKYGISGPSDVMWTHDDEIRDEFAAVIKAGVRDAAWLERVSAVIKRAGEMIYKEENILLPNCAANFTREEWVGIYFDSKDYPDCLGVVPQRWALAERAKYVVEGASPEDMEIVMPGGHMNVAQLTALLNTLPFEITFVDDQNINRFFNEGPKDFKRPGMAIDREVFSCHPPKVEAQVRRVIEEFRKGTLDEVPVWMEKNGKTMLVKYMAVRDKKGAYLGTVEIVQNMDFAKEHFV